VRKVRQCNAPARRRRQRLGELGVLVDGRTQRCEVVDDLCARVSKRRAARGALLQSQRGKRSTPAAAAPWAWRHAEALPAVTTRRTAAACRRRTNTLPPTAYAHLRNADEADALEACLAHELRTHKALGQRQRGRHAVAVEVG